ncbi:adenosine deaminase [Allopusillimonas ginsengisoli]|nr:adenosine deaminase [Allopusillimonas ginsengisoli]
MNVETGAPSLQFIRALPKTELHLHIEGTLEPELIFELAQRNKIHLPYANIDRLRDAYKFSNLQSFLDLYYAGASVLLTERDFYDMTMAYMRRAQDDGVIHAEIMFDPQTHTQRGVKLETVFAGISRALREVRETTGITSSLILSFLRHLSENDALETFDAALALRRQYEDLWISVGLDSAELGNPPEKFARVFALARELGFRLVVHAGEEGPASYVCNALDILHAERIDHGVASEQDPDLMHRLQVEQIPLTVCPLSNLKLCVIQNLREHNLARMLRQGLLVTVNSDDPAYFGGYLADNYAASAEALDLSHKEVAILARNSIVASFLPDDAKQKLLDLWTAKVHELMPHAFAS